MGELERKVLRQALAQKAKDLKGLIEWHYMDNREESLKTWKEELAVCRDLLKRITKINVQVKADSFDSGVSQ